MQELIDLLMRPETLVRGLSIAVLVTVATQAIRLFGPVIGGLISSMPMVSAPAYFIMIGQSSVPFVTEAVTYSLIYMGAAQIFLLLFMHCVRRMSLRACFLVAGTGWCAMILLLRLLPPNPWLGASSFIAITLITRRLARPALGLPATTMSVDRPWLALVKGLSAGTVVAISTSVAGQLGTSWSGVLLVFPVAFVVLCATALELFGPDTLVATLYSAMRGATSLAGFCFAMAIGLGHFDPMTAFWIGIVTAVIITAGMSRLRSGQGSSPPGISPC